MAGDVDVRDLYDEALAWVAGLMRTVPASLLSRSTPCPEFSVRALMGHLVGTAERGLATAQHRPITSIPHVVTDIPDEAFATRYGELAAYLHAAWSEVGRRNEVRAPWGPTTADAAVWGFATETLVHGWDLAVATDQPSEARQGLVQPLLTRATTTVPASNRKRSYAEMVTSTPDAGPTEQLANWLGHRR
ncbi:MAG: TIGR03086 family metal-binding protein [Actinomycetota bacterium]|nr:TIGR03086 family metal-binding protein [Actinomycetota bacterium]